MVTRWPSRPRQPLSRGGYTLSELMMATAIFSTVSAALLLGFVSLKRSYAATSDFAINHADQMRISDYMAMDFRRAVKVDPPSRNDVSIYIPTYYDGTSEHNPLTPALDGKGGVYYGALDASIKIHYYLSGSTIYRQVGADAPVVLASDVQDFIFDTTDLGKVIKTSITFKPTFRSMGASREVAQMTAFYNTTLLRNNRGVY
jgi:prepilin-type N-terminal cleavage/methylation domain-containing protein